MKVSSLNLCPAVILLGAAATMSINYTSVGLCRATVVASSAPAFNFLAFRSFAVSLLERLLATGAEYVVEGVICEPI